MKKSRFFALILAVSVMLMGAGYAAWTDTLTVTSNVTTGTLDVDLGNGTVEVQGEDGYTINRTAEAIVNEDSNDNSGTVTITNLYPGAVAVVTVPVTNNGTIPVLVDDISTPNVTNYTIDVTEPGELAVGETGNIVFTITVGDNAPQDTTVNFDYTFSYKQFNK